jgi:hypothetical protein
MNPCTPTTRWRTLAGPMVLAATAFALTALVAGCGGSSSPGPQSARPAAKTKATACGNAKTAANVPVHVEVTAGQVSCTTALSIERKYAQAIRSGKVPGNGGGAPVRIGSWTCQGYTTPEVLKTGKASICADGASRILAILASA